MSETGLADSLDLGVAADAPKPEETRVITEVVRNEADVVKLNERPEGIPETLWDDKAKDINKTALIEAYKQKDKQTLDLRKIISKGEQNVPPKPEDYKLELDQTLAKFAPEGDPAIEVAKTAALEAGLSLDQFNKFVKGYLGGLNAKQMIAEPVPELTPEQEAAENKKFFDAEMEKLGDTGKAHFEEFNTIMRDGLAKGSFTDADKEIYKDIMRSADHVRFMKKMANTLTTRPSTSLGIPSAHVVADGQLTREELQAMQADPKYQNESGYKKIMEGYRKLEAQNRL